jgi:hypothetical protein
VDQVSPRALQKSGAKFDFFEHRRIGPNARMLCFGTVGSGPAAIPTELARAMVTSSLAAMSRRSAASTVPSPRSAATR